MGPLAQYADTVQHLSRLMNGHVPHTYGSPLRYGGLIFTPSIIGASRHPHRQESGAAVFAI